VFIEHPFLFVLGNSRTSRPTLKTKDKKIKNPSTVEYVAGLIIFKRGLSQTMFRRLPSFLLVDFEKLLFRLGYLGYQPLLPTDSQYHLNKRKL
jgi:hypothetical protein